MPVQRNSAICVVIEGLRASALGAYGNTWFDTPALDRLASESVTLDQAMIDTPDQDRLYQSYWQALHAMRPAGSGRDLPNLIDMAADRNMITALLTDRREIADHPLGAAFHDAVAVPTGDDQDDLVPARAIHETHIAKLVALAVDWLAQHTARRRPAPFLLWIHSRGMMAGWDAPTELRNRLAEPEDPRPTAEVAMPCRVLPPDHDPDDVFRAACAYAGQIMVVDACVDVLLDQIRQSPLRETTLVTLIGACGFPLGEHRALGPADGRLYGETVHVPWLIRLPDASAALGRSQALVQPPDLAATLADWLGAGAELPPRDGKSLIALSRGHADAVRDWALTTSGDECGLRTPAWYLRRCPAERSELFVKPDDRWEVNDVADRCDDVVAGLAAVMDRLVAGLGSGGPVDLPPLASPLVTRVL